MFQAPYFNGYSPTPKTTSVVRFFRLNFLSLIFKVISTISNTEQKSPGEESKY